LPGPLARSSGGRSPRLLPVGFAETQEALASEKRPIASRVLGNPETNARNLMVHCAQEMNHLAGFLPELYEAFGSE